MKELTKNLNKISGISRNIYPYVENHMNSLTKPPGSLGYLETIAGKFCMITDTVNPVIKKKRIYTFAADHGVAEEGVSAFPQEVTYQMVMNMLNGGAAVNVFASHGGVEVKVVDAGVNAEFGSHPGLINRKVRAGTRNMTKEPAMTIEETLQAMKTGIELATTSFKEGVSILGTGEMGIANTTASSALFAAFLPCEVYMITGRGTGISDERLENKRNVIENALKKHAAFLNDPISTLAALGGYEIAAIAGLCIGASLCRIPVVIDGFISSAGAFSAMKLNSKIRDYLFFSHQSAEPGHGIFLQKIREKPILDLGMRLGEGTGAALAINIIEAAVKMYNEMATFESAGVADAFDNVRK